MIPPNQDVERTARMRIPQRLLMPGNYSLIAGLLEMTGAPLDVHRFVCQFMIEDAGDEMALNPNVDYGVVFADCAWEI